METTKRKPYVLGLSIGTFWLIAASTAFSILALTFVRTSDARAALAAVIIGALSLGTVSTTQVRAATRLPAVPQTGAGRKIGRLFGLTVIAEVAGLVIVNAAARFSGHRSMRIPLSLFVVGLHFLPLAKIFGVPRYTMLGILFCAISALTLLLVPAEARVGE